MNIHRLHPLAALGLFGAGLVTGPLDGGLQDTVQDPAPQVGSLAARVEAQEVTIAKLEAGHTALQTQVEALTTAIAAQSSQADALLGVLSQSEELGFTAGLNPKSREVLLAGFRTYLDGAKDSLKDLGKNANKRTKEKAKTR